MFIKRLDFLSPPITFYHQGLLYHSSFVSGIISIISIILIIILTVHYSKELIEKKEPKYFSYNSFIEDSGVFPMNDSSLFHFLSVASKKSNFINDGIDFSLFNIVGLEDYFENYLNDNNLSHYNHWLYGKCNSKMDTEGLGNLIQFEFFERSACIRKFFNKEEQKYYNVGDSNFRWPVIAHGTYSKNAKLYNIIVEKCEESILNLILGEGHQCKNTSEFEFSQNYTFYGEIVLNIVNHYVDISNYTNPYIKYIEMIANSLLSNLYSVNHINFNPSVIKTYNGLISDKYNEKDSPIYERHDVYSFNRENKDIYSVFVIWLKNKLYRNIEMKDFIANCKMLFQVLVEFINP